MTAHVDDFAVIAAQKQDADWLIDAMGCKFQIKNLSELHHYLGMEIIRSNGQIKLTQTAYVDDLVTTTGLLDANPMKLPADPGLQIDDIPDPEIAHEFNWISGSLQWLATKTWPDIVCIASLLA
jgi:hypothetical protein